MSAAMLRSDLRIASDARLIERHRLARRALRRGLSPDVVKDVFELSPTALEQLAGQERAA